VGHPAIAGGIEPEGAWAEFSLRFIDTLAEAESVAIHGEWPIVWNHMGGRVAPSIFIPQELSYSWFIEAKANAQSALFVTVTK
jgi:hypothetical protein